VYNEAINSKASIPRNLSTKENIMEKEYFSVFTQILEDELVPALGCTEPIAIAFAAAKARDVLGVMPDRMIASCSGNIIKNVKSVIVPSTDGMKGISVSAIIGAVGGDASLGLEVLTKVTEDEIAKAKELEAQRICEVRLLENVPNLDIIIEAFSGEDSALVELRNAHTNIYRIEKNGEVLYQSDCADSVETPSYDTSLLTLENIKEYAENVDLDDIKPILHRQLACNLEIAHEGVTRNYGANVGKTILRHFGNHWEEMACAYAAAGSDARMSGCCLPVVINSGSGNQGITASVPVYIYAKNLRVPDEQLYRALAFSNLTAIYQKQKLGKLSAYCGAVSAATGAGAAITFLSGGTLEQISDTITNTIANISGIVCDGAKSSCAAKIATSLHAAITAHYMSMDDYVFQPGEGLVRDTLEETVSAYTTMGRVGMKDTDVAILNMMIS
jgi:L-cysteine desulfidase